MPAQRVAVDCSSPDATLRTLALAYVHGDAAAVLGCIDDNDSAWPRGRVQGWAGFVEAAGRLRRAADAAWGEGAGDRLVRYVLMRDPKEEGEAMLARLERGSLADIDGDVSRAAVAESFVLGSTWLTRSQDGWKLVGGPQHRQPPLQIDPQLLREAMDRSDRMVVADAETAHMLADKIESGALTSFNKARSVGERERDRSRERAGVTDERFTRKLFAAVKSDA